MADTNLLILAREFKKLRTHVQEVLKMPVGPQGLQGEKGEQGVKGDTGAPGKDGKDGKDGVNGLNGQDGRNGADGKDGKDGLDGVGVQNAYIDFDNSLVIVLTNGQEINAGFLSQDAKEAVVATFKQGAQTLNELLPIQTGNANKFLKTDGENVSWDTLDGSDINLASPPVIGNTTPNAATFTTLTATGQTSLGGAAGAEGLRVIPVASSDTPWILTAGRAGVQGGRFTTLSPAIQSTDSAPVDLRTNAGTSGGVGSLQARISHTASAVNYVQVTGAATGAGPIISVQGSDSNAEFKYRTKGIFNHVFENGSGAANFIVNQTAGSSVVNRLSVAGSLTNQEPVMSAVGSDTNISMAFQSKGTGAIDLAAGSSGVNISNGTTVTALTMTNSGSLYNPSGPTVSISAPTTAGGVQATASVTNMNTSGTPTVVSGGTGYTNGDTLTIAGTGATLTVTGVSGGVITSAASGNFFPVPLASIPANPVSVTGGTGSGATFNVLWKPLSLTITNAGSGYVEQPTVTFSGGGGSGAAAYATVGSFTTIKSIGSGTGVVTNQSMIFQTPNSITSGNPAFVIRDIAGFDSWYQMSPASSQAVFVAKGNANANAFLGANGSGSVRLTTNGDSVTEQLRVTHTASAVNYVQVTGATTNNKAEISGQGSDASVGILYKTKSLGFHEFQVNQRRVLQLGYTTGTDVNYVNLLSNAAGAAPTFSAAGSDTNIDLALTPKGAGLVRFGTYTAGAPTATGYINIKAADGTIYKLLVST